MISFNLDFSSEKCALVCSNFGISSRHRNIFNLNDLDPNNLGFDINNGITLITGHSGVGKSTIGEVLRERYSFFDIKDIIISDVNSPIIDIIDADFKDSICFLNIAGLSGPYLYLTSYKNLSSGQKFRFMIALMISKGVKKIYCDEFCSDLDRSTAYFLSYNLRRFSTKLGVSFIFISNDKNIKDYLFPDNYLSFDLYSNISINKSVDLIENPFKKHLVVKEASYEDYCLLEKYHYFPSAEESINLSYNAKYYTLEYKEDVVGGLIIRDPYSNEEENDSLLNINNKIKVLYRVILHPLVRGCGILRFFLDNIYTIYSGKILYVESALARFVPIFESMGWVSLDESKFFYKKGLLLESENINYLLNCLGDMIYNKYIDFCTISNIKSSINKDEIIDSLKSEFNEEDTDFIRECLELYDMKRFIYEIK